MDGWFGGIWGKLGEILILGEMWEVAIIYVIFFELLFSVVGFLWKSMRQLWFKPEGYLSPVQTIHQKTN